MTRSSDCDHIVSQGTLRKGSARVDYYTTTPAPRQWIAVGVLFSRLQDARSINCRRLLVGNGTTERGAVADLNAHFSAAVAQLEEKQTDREVTEPEKALHRSRYSSGSVFNDPRVESDEVLREDPSTA